MIRTNFTNLTFLSLASALLLNLGCSALSEGSGGKGFKGLPGTGGSGTGGTMLGNGGFGFGGGNAGGYAPSGGVPQTCAQAVQQQSYIGCEYWPTVTSNAGLFAQFEFAIAVSNPTNNEAQVTVARGSTVLAQEPLASGELKVIKLPWVDELKQLDTVGDGSELNSILLAGGAYKVTSTVPITLYQFNPLEFQLATNPPDCPNGDVLGGCFSFSNDASLVLPKTALRGDYYTMSAPTFHLAWANFMETLWTDNPGFVAVTATEDGTHVTVHSSAHVRGGPGVGPIVPGGQGDWDMNAGDVLMLQTSALPAIETPLPGKPCETENQGLYDVIKCPAPPEYDLTGSFITATKPVSVIGGHDCTFVPYNRFACDHLEESLFPVEALGKDFVVTAPQAVATIDTAPGTPDNMYVRVLSAVNDNNITFDPAVSGPVTLHAGHWVEIGPVTQDFRVQADNKILVGQFMVGENFSGQSAGAGDPALSVAIPTEQYRLSYSFYAPTTYTHNFVNVVAAPTTTVTIDDTVIPSGSFAAIGASGMAVARHKINGGTHSISADGNFGIVVYGYGSYTSYMYPGGLNLETIIIGPN